MQPLPEPLAEGLNRLASALPTGRLAELTGRLIDRYQADRPAPAGAPIVAAEEQAAAYALYRMPATYAAIRSALRQAAAAVPGFRPERHVDLGGGTGGAVWAAAETWPGITGHQVIEQAPAMITVGRRLVAGTGGPIGGTDWTRSVLDGALTLPDADLITISYVLGELDPELRRTMITKLADSGATIAIIEPGTKAGYRRVLEARQQLITAGLRVAAPCPHDLDCPMTDEDWCHFAVRIGRSVTHRLIKNAELSYEDEKFSYLVATRQPVEPADARILRHPGYAKGQVDLTLCTVPPGIQRTKITKRAKEDYRRARKIEWGDAWPDVP
ncbi:small ribosomal subunit Rsm22 family protein [Microlunatus sp. GCM10028923]|uniref:small ribosomal subunit Rsm22 family protein n=1 Tax=Microlunatus sp. GCM10028923 TaxID=3273400 RepID=UPI0036162B6F